MIFWLDLETTGLNPEKDAVLELALIVTNNQLEVQHSYQAVIKQTQTTMDRMNDWCKSQHSKSGLIDEVWGDKAVTYEAVAKELEMAVLNFSDPFNRPILAGSSIHFDRGFLRTNFPDFFSKLHYRMIDVSSFKEGFKRQLGIEIPKKEGDIAHRAMPDILNSINEYIFYMSHFSKKD